MPYPIAYATVLAAVALTWPLAGAAAEPDPGRGGLLYENHCWECHTSDVHFRSRRKSSNIADVRGWVARWQAELGLNWTADEIEDVTSYLNTRFYVFPKNPE